MTNINGASNIIKLKNKNGKIIQIYTDLGLNLNNQTECTIYPNKDIVTFLYNLFDNSKKKISFYIYGDFSNIMHNMIYRNRLLKLKTNYKNENVKFIIIFNDFKITTHTDNLFNMINDLFKSNSVLDIRVSFLGYKVMLENGQKIIETMNEYYNKNKGDKKHKKINETFNIVKKEVLKYNKKMINLINDFLIKIKKKTEIHYYECPKPLEKGRYFSLYNINEKNNTEREIEDIRNFYSNALYYLFNIYLDNETLKNIEKDNSEIIVIYTSVFSSTNLIKNLVQYFDYEIEYCSYPKNIENINTIVKKYDDYKDFYKLESLFRDYNNYYSQCADASGIVNDF